MTPEALRDEILRSSLKFIKANGLSQESLRLIYGSLWQADEKITELVAPKLKNKSLSIGNRGGS